MYPLQLNIAQQSYGSARQDVYELQRPLERWSRGRAVLLGDACHVIPPNLAQASSAPRSPRRDLQGHVTCKGT